MPSPTDAKQSQIDFESENSMMETETWNIIIAEKVLPKSVAGNETFSSCIYSFGRQDPVEITINLSHLICVIGFKLCDDHWFDCSMDLHTPSILITAHFPTELTHTNPSLYSYLNYIPACIWLSSHSVGSADVGAKRQI